MPGFLTWRYSIGNWYALSSRDSVFLCCYLAPIRECKQATHYLAIVFCRYLVSAVPSTHPVGGYTLKPATLVTPGWLLGVTYSLSWALSGCRAILWCCHGRVERDAERYLAVVHVFVYDIQCPDGWHGVMSPSETWAQINVGDPADMPFNRPNYNVYAP